MKLEVPISTVTQPVAYSLTVGICLSFILIHGGK